MMQDLLKSISLPSIAKIKNTYGSMLILEINEKKSKIKFLIDRCRWIILDRDEIVFYDLDIDHHFNFEYILPNMRIERILFNDRHIIFYFGRREFWIFMTEAYHKFLNDGVKTSDPLWNELPQDQKDNLSVSFEDGRKTVGYEFGTFLTPESYPWGKEFLRRDSELLPINPPN